MNTALFVTGTDTGVGKTIVTGALAAALRHRGVPVGVMKPAESGCARDGARLVPEDALFLKRVSGCAAPLEVVNPYALAAPLAPALAAEQAGVSISLDHLRACFRQLADEHEVVLVEGAGGLLVPLAGDVTMRDLAVDLGLPVLVVAANVLGTINHTALTVAAARQAGLTVVGTVLNQPRPPSDLAARTNAASLQRWGGAPLLGELPHGTASDDAWLVERGLPLLDALAAAGHPLPMPPICGAAP